LNENGFPIHFEIFDGNIQDKDTVIQVIEKIKERFNIEKVIFVGDRGMISTKNIEKLIELELGYILALKHKEARDTP
jgi:transposase